ncbi:serine hydrolase domain-containing protein [Marinicella meishanensis]|uniref:serine hydrolase domain-containing protein n=1 Tax=Marinicella meishanensis TaxID=2873263 RepID=UPI001CC172A0|nr:serine hydrolase domain-containing protein [Marinicella sp. NBU2979]
MQINPFRSIALCFLLIALILTLEVRGAEHNKLSTQLSQIADELFMPLVDDGPGFAIGVFHQGRILFKASYGYKNLEEQSEFKPDDLFYIASISKQFTAGIVFQLVNEGRVQLSDRITKYVPNLPQAYESITISQLLYHTSGVREYTSLMLFRGDDSRLQNRMSGQHALQLISQQNTLDFEPGSQFRYSSSGYVLLARMIETIENQSFRSVVEKRIFGPLRMEESHVDDDHGDVIENRVISYQPGGESSSSWRRWLKHFDVVGDGGVFTTISDMAKWDAELRDPQHFGEQWKNQMYQKGSLIDGTEVNYAGAIQYTTINKQLVQWHGGGMGGYVSDFFRVPDLDISVVVFANRNDDKAFQGWHFIRQVIPLFTQTTPVEVTEELPKDENELNFTYVQADDYPGIQGAYFLREKNNRQYLRKRENGQLALHDGSDQFMADLIKVNHHKWLASPGDQIITISKVNGRYEFNFKADNESYTAYQYDDSLPQSSEDLNHLIGRYCSKELESWIEISQQDGRIFYRHDKGLPTEIYPSPKDSRINWNSRSIVWVGYGMFEFDWSTDQPSEQLTVGDFRVSGVQFNRCEP